jgi:hypothetical protein
VKILRVAYNNAELKPDEEIDFFKWTHPTASTPLNKVKTATDFQILVTNFNWNTVETMNLCVMWSLEIDALRTDDLSAWKILQESICQHITRKGLAEKKDLVGRASHMAGEALCYGNSGKVTVQKNHFHNLFSHAV